MSEDRSRQGFFSRMFAPPDEEGEGTTIYSRDDVEGYEESEAEAEQNLRGFTVERAADIIRDLPPEVPRRSAVRIVRGTLTAAGISVQDLGRSTRARESKLNSEIELRQQRIQELQERTDEVVRDLEEQIRKAREARDHGVAEEERGISEARSGLDDVEKVRDFFDLPRGESRSTPLGEQRDVGRVEEETTRSSEPYVGDETQVMDRSQMPDVDDTQILRPRGPLSEEWDARRDKENQ